MSEQDAYGRKIARFWSLPVGTRCHQEPIIWGFIKIGWCKVRLVDMTVTMYVLPWSKVTVISSQEDVF